MSKIIIKDPSKKSQCREKFSRTKFLLHFTWLSLPPILLLSRNFPDVFANLSDTHTHTHVRCCGVRESGRKMGLVVGVVTFEPCVSQKFRICSSVCITDHWPKWRKWCTRASLVSLALKLNYSRHFLWRKLVANVEVVLLSWRKHWLSEGTRSRLKSRNRTKGLSARKIMKYGDFDV